MQQQFNAVVHAFCRAEKFNAPERLIEGESVELHGVEFSFVYDEEICADAMHLRVVFGNAPLKDETAIFRALLNENHLGYTGKGPGFCVSPASGLVLYMLQLRLCDATPAQLAGTMLYFTGKVKEWRSTYFLKSAVRRERRLQMT
ncbi:hypothetical protein [Actimicrobium antarcticum]|uniref:Tir chaperone protein (CesT) family protein n=1 Tax=Actimicrobium antarcticum TaxID=1051899 RepID=A0ABP7SZA2_9BURK